MKGQDLDWTEAETARFRRDFLQNQARQTFILRLAAPDNQPLAEQLERQIREAYAGQLAYVEVMRRLNDAR